MKISITLPDEIAGRIGEEPAEAGRHLLEDAAVENYRTGRLSQRQVAVMLGLDFWQTEKFLKDRAVFLNYAAGDVEKDSTALYKIFGRK